MLACLNKNTVEDRDFSSAEISFTKLLLSCFFVPFVVPNSFLLCVFCAFLWLKFFSFFRENQCQSVAQIISSFSYNCNTTYSKTLKRRIPGSTISISLPKTLEILLKPHHINIPKSIFSCFGIIFISLQGFQIIR
jgi:hypothetical protein